MDNENFELDKKEIILALILIILVIIAYFIFSYGQYLECVKPFEIASNYFEDKDPTTVAQALVKTPSELASECEFPAIP